MAQTIPVIDFSPFFSNNAAARREVARQMRLASQEWGFFYLSGHGMPDEALERGFQASRDFFALPEEQKMQVAWQSASSNRGYVAVRRESLDPTKPGDLKEAFNAGVESTPTAATDDERPYTENLWPEGHPGFRRDVSDLLAGCVETANRVLAAFALALDKPEEFFVDAHNAKDHTLRLLHYPPLPEGFQPADGESRAGVHTDYGSITLLFQDDAGGLEVRTRDGRWIAAPPIPGTVVVNTGDLMERWTNHVFCSTPHRVSVPEEATRKDRCSIAFFCHPNHDHEIRCIDTCTDTAHPPMYEPITAGDHLMERLNATY